MSLEYIRNYYGVPAEVGRRVIVYGKPGIIVGHSGPHIGVNFDSDKPGVIRPAHPVCEVKYLSMGQVRKLTRSQERYARYRRCSECFESFLQFCYYDARRSVSF